VTRSDQCIYTLESNDYIDSPRHLIAFAAYRRVQKALHLDPNDDQRHHPKRNRPWQGTCANKCRLRYLRVEFLIGMSRLSNLREMLNIGPCF
jgi:hypothetical protein